MLVELERTFADTARSPPDAAGPTARPPDRPLPLTASLVERLQSPGLGPLAGQRDARAAKPVLDLDLDLDLDREP
ncbi:hypothetical protein GGTG_13784 [Gaeumannomyces tritici R3-111a-1]|uniref:Uncharacterized protein n=1 Tax=Gaeumannomyces tritici (strain R3-111a-1) TaxID=644352 RepID=J3PJU5_GAET3|nr:hypothetical protein GGTG_13784 [Gaeumannomyces tritici R3-111a-1]EJT68644.1 hypothetical protein GGTG_13784 [Gaeumannomyces tritici R3-111a-1]